MRIALVTGLHGLARHEAAQALLSTSPHSLAVHHDLARTGEGTVLRLTHGADGTHEREQVRLDHACASCTLREDLIPFLLRTAEAGHHDLVVVEAWNSVEPQLIAESIAARDELRLAAVVTAVDTARLTTDLSTHDDLTDRGLDIAQDDHRTVTEVLTRQIEYPGLLALRGEPTPHTLALLAQLNPGAPAVPTHAAADGWSGTEFDTGAARARTEPAWAHYTDHPEEHGVSTVTWTRTRPLHPGRLARALEDLASVSLRGRGRFWLAGRPDNLMVWDSHQDLLLVDNGGPWLAALPGAALDLVSPERRAAALRDWDPEVGDRRQHLAFTGVDMDARALVELLDSCLATDEETGQGFRHDPFSALSER
ncbi:CobW family GTP-binding protein [Nocardiopsis kunsanensis]|uniref:CobW family GTP-binding protein n=1 Tax=Nocardiopsis kunsanensis TaxID=141693 RepID=UPI00034572A2|nr:GTP-binding protein [Nocardiopsis kunsanensis]